MLALIAGRGGLPAAVATGLAHPPLICSLEGNAPDALSVDITFRIELLGSFLTTLLDRGVTEVCFCGGVVRPVIDPSLIDAATAPLVPRLAGALAGGEDSALRAIVAIFEKTGLVVRGAHDVAPALLPAVGVWPAQGAEPNLGRDPEIAQQILNDQSAADLGQACVIRDGALLAREDARGTDAMLYDLAEIRADTGTGGVLFKGPKPGQDRRVDLPTIGPHTVQRAATAGLAGVVIEAGGVMVLEQDHVSRLLSETGLFLWVR